MLGVIKVLLAGWHGQIPASLFTDNPTTQVDWDRTGLRLATKLHPWSRRTEAGTARSRRTAPAASTHTRSSACRSERSTTISEYRLPDGTVPVCCRRIPQPVRAEARALLAYLDDHLPCHRNAWPTCCFGPASRGGTAHCRW